ncbi:hypothetical protein [Alicyclobacillus tolerans]|uniref:Retron-type reverse transcriptase n=1 Tax=Alicyclobacillus tolerans TaxID=90970 RepID=A0ABT9LZI2_9BACL|nr:hypothetical protein [Alicyclobacillus tengchongensis]MDP9729662.1 retron-type reverse transcriptase [Alicyclobacillus tengchongensis]
MKWYNLYGQLLSYQRLSEAWLKVKANKGTGGVDGINLSAFERNLEENLQQLLSDLKAKTYKPMPVLRMYDGQGSWDIFMVSVFILVDTFLCA